MFSVNAVAVLQTKIVPLRVGPTQTELSALCRACKTEKHRGIQPPWVEGDDMEAEIGFSAAVPLTEQNGIVCCDHGHPHPWQRDP
jgi:hypothetical protein